MLLRLLAFMLCYLSFSAASAVILQYHHVSDTTPNSTSISPAQFERHLQYLADQHFNVVPLTQLIDAIKKQQPLKDKTVAITFDDAYTDILHNAKPLLDQFNYPYTIFINPNSIKLDSDRYLSWQQIKKLAEDGVIIANHGLEHNSMIRVPDDMSESQWLAQETASLVKAESLIKEHTGQNWQYFAYPYGEYTPAIQQWLKKNGYVGFTQQSGAVGLNTELTSIPRYPASKPYDKLISLRDKLNSLPLGISLDKDNAETIYEYNTLHSVSFNIDADDFRRSQLHCYISGLGKQKIIWQGENMFTINFSAPLPVGRVRCNCTAPSLSEPGRYYWYSKPWFILKEGRKWYPL
ncbi:polysaccharide deacetylase family protein [Colwelliaceae bacterium 6471]